MLEVVDARHAAAVGLAHARADGRVELALGRRRCRLPALPGLVLAQQSRRLARGRRGQDGVAVVGRDDAGPAAARVLELGRLDGLCEAVAQRVGEHPALARRRLAQDCEHVLRRRGAREVGLLARERPLEEVHVRVVEPRRDAAAPEIDPLGRDG